MAQIDSTVIFPHPTGIVIGDGVIVRERVRIFQNVTLGGARIGDQRLNRYPEIGADTVLFAGAVVVGDVRIGRNCVIGANAVVLRDLPDNSVAVGVPARNIGAPSLAATGTPCEEISA
jgi:serine O-acetyltransferase